ncbi:unnamed protein product [Cylindrotheca closterium]|uniref:RRM domain-containing protein n=1 Tax=Cylindrotheca closterium TaxID=2856 RepID=A0AAD2CNF3_9STRA|nr:unnamed protein product [Cylindrotheca closterium]
MTVRITLFFFLAVSVTSFTLRTPVLRPSRVSIPQRLSQESAENIAPVIESVPEELATFDVVESSGDALNEGTQSNEVIGDAAKAERHTIYIGNLPYSTTVRDVRALVEDIADVRYIKLPKDREVDRIKGFGFVDVASADDVLKIVDALNGFEMEGRQLRVSRSLEKDQIRSTKREVVGSKKLYIGNLSYKCTKEHLSEYIGEFGQLTDVFIPQDNYGNPRGFAFIAVKDEDVEAVIEGADGKEFMGRPIAVNHPLPPGEKSPKRKERPGRLKLYVGNLAFYTSSETLSEVFSEFGDVFDVYIPRDIETDRARGFGFVSMGSEAGNAAIDALDGCELDGRIISVNAAKPREEKQNSDSDSEQDEQSN